MTAEEAAKMTEQALNEPACSKTKDLLERIYAQIRDEAKRLNYSCVFRISEAAYPYEVFRRATHILYLKGYQVRMNGSFEHCIVFNICWGTQDETV